MKSPFPGMDPYLERHWPDVHATLIAFSKETLNSLLPSDLAARSEEQLVIGSEDWDEEMGTRPDVQVFEPGRSTAKFGGIALEAPIKLVVHLDPLKERFIKIIRPEDERVITVIEYISPWNKRGKGIARYLQKRDAFLKSGVNVVEIDLVRNGDWMELLSPHACPAEGRTAYRAIIRLGGERSAAYIFPIPLRVPLCQIPVPLRPEDPRVALDLQSLVERVYVAGRYGSTLDYDRQLRPSLNPDDARWADELLRAAGKR